MIKCVLEVPGPKSTNVCQDEYPCSGLKAGIDDAINRVQAIWDANLSMENWVFLLVDSKNTADYINPIGMIWTIRCLWPYRARFFNFYRHWSLLVFHNGNGIAIFWHIRECLTKGDPIDMVDRGIGILTLIKNRNQNFLA